MKQALKRATRDVGENAIGIQQRMNSLSMLSMQLLVRMMMAYGAELIHEVL
jgi:hypothetical protein